MSILFLNFVAKLENKEKAMKQNVLSHPVRPMERQAAGRHRHPVTNVAGLLVVQEVMRGGNRKKTAENLCMCEFFIKNTHKPRA